MTLTSNFEYKGGHFDFKAYLPIINMIRFIYDTFLLILIDKYPAKFSLKKNGEYLTFYFP